MHGEMQISEEGMKRAKSERARRITQGPRSHIKPLVASRNWKRSGEDHVCRWWRWGNTFLSERSWKTSKGTLCLRQENYLKDPWLKSLLSLCTCTQMKYADSLGRNRKSSFISLSGKEEGTRRLVPRRLWPPPPLGDRKVSSQNSWSGGKGLRSKLCQPQTLSSAKLPNSCSWCQAALEWILVVSLVLYSSLGDGGQRNILGKN